MPVAKIKLPNGKVGRFNVPEGTTQDQVMEYVNSNLDMFSVGQEEKSQASTIGESRRRGRRSVAFQPEAQDPSDVSALGALGRGLAQGATLGTADEIAAAASGAYGALTGDESFSDIYDREQQEWQDILEKDIQQQPVASIGGQLIGGIATGGGVGATRAGAGIARAVSQGSRLARTGKAAALGSGVGAFEGAASSAQGERGEGAVLGGLTGGVLGGGSQGARELYDVYKSGKGAVRSVDLKGLANQAYRKTEELGGAFDTTVTNKMLDDMAEAVPKDEFDDALGGAKVAEFVQGISDTLRDQPITLERADKINKRINRLMDKAPFFENNRITEDGKDLLKIKEILENAIDEAPDTAIIGAETRESIDALKEGRKLWGQSRRLGEVERLIRKAMTKEQPAKSLMTAFTNLLEDPKKIKGFTEEEKQAIQVAAQSGVLNDVVRLFGSRLVPIITGSTGADLGAVVGATAGSGVSRSLGANIQADKARDVLDVIAGTRKTLDDPAREMADPRITGAAVGGVTQAVESGRDYLTSEPEIRSEFEVRATRPPRSTDRLQRLRGILEGDQSTLQQPKFQDKVKIKNPHSTYIKKYSRKNDIDPNLIAAVIKKESNFKPRARSQVGAQGLMQIMPETAKNPGFGVKPFDKKKSLYDVAENVRFGTDYLSAMLKRYDNDVEAALVAYNAGAGNADKWLQSGRDYSVLPDRKQTEDYAKTILSNYQETV